MMQGFDYNNWQSLIPLFRDYRDLAFFLFFKH